MKAAPDVRLHFLDGLRGWGAVVVVLYHVFLDGFSINQTVSDTLRPIFLFNGVLAVWVFFLVSGFSLSIAFLRRPDYAGLTNIALGRYFRLALPVLCVTLVLYAFFAVGLVLPAEKRLPAFQTFLPVAPSLWQVFRSSLFDTFFDYSFATTLIAPLWTMRFELWGSCLVLGVLFVAGRLERRFLVYSAVGVVSYFVHPIYTAFIVGLVFAEIYVSDSWKRSKGNWSSATFLLFIPGVYGASLLHKAGEEPWGASLTVAILLTIPCIFNPPTARLLSGPISRFLGRISFPLYLIHGPLMLAYGNNAYRWIDEPTDVQKMLLNLSTVAVSIACATLLAPTDRWGIAAAKRFSAYLMGSSGTPSQAKNDARTTPR